MLQSGPSREAFEAWAGARRNLVVLTGYTVRGTLADEIKKDQELLQLPDRQIRRRCVVEVISFSAHSDYNQTRDFIARLRVPNVVLVHGERTEMKRLQEKLLYENPALSVFTPEILQTVALQFKANRCAVALGDAAARLQQVLPHKTPAALHLKGESQQQEQQADKSTQEHQQEATVAGCAEDDWDSLLLLQQGQQPLLLAATETEAITGIACATLQQQVTAPFPRPLSILWQAAADIFDDIRPLKCTCSSSSSSTGGAVEAENTPKPCSDCCAFSVAGCVAVRRVDEGDVSPSSMARKEDATGASAAAGLAAVLEDRERNDSPSRAAAQKAWIEVSWEASPTADLVADSLLFLACDLLRPTVEGFSAESDTQGNTGSERGGGGSSRDSTSTRAEVTAEDGELLLLQIVQQHLTEHFGPVRLCRRRKGTSSRSSDGSTPTAPAEAAPRETVGCELYEDVPIAEAAVARSGTLDLCLVFETTGEQTSATVASDTQGATAKPEGSATDTAAAHTAAAGSDVPREGEAKKQSGEPPSPSSRQYGEVVQVCIDFAERQVSVFWSVLSALVHHFAGQAYCWNFGGECCCFLRCLCRSSAATRR